MCSQKLEEVSLIYTIQSHTSILRVHSTVQRHQSAERPILCQISSLMYPKIQRRQVIVNVLHPGCAWPPSSPVLWSRFKDGLASICILIHSYKMPKESETTGLNNGWKWWLVGNHHHHLFAQYAEMNSKICNVPDRKANSFSSNNCL